MLSNDANKVPAPNFDLLPIFALRFLDSNDSGHSSSADFDSVLYNRPGGWHPFELAVRPLLKAGQIGFGQFD